MLANMSCWIIAIGIMISGSTSQEDLYIKTLLAMGFIFLGTLSKAVDVYKDVHKNDNIQSATQTGPIMERENK